MDPVRLAPAVDSPNQQEIQKISDQYGLSLTPEEAAEFEAVVKHMSSSFRRIDDIPQPTLAVKYPRTPGYRPDEKENPHKAWTWKTRVEGNKEGILAGKTIALKDTVCLAGVPMQNGSHVLDGYVPHEDATIATRILDAGGIIVGKTANEDLCLSGGSYTCCTGPVRNAIQPNNQAGGSSSGSGVVVRLGEADLAIAGDQGGSIRIPSCWNGVVGFKPTHGLAPYTGVYSMEATLDNVGPVGKTVDDVALLLQAIAGRDGLDDIRQANTPLQLPPYSEITLDINSKEKAVETLKAYRVGVLVEGFNIPNTSEKYIDSNVAAAIDAVFRNHACGVEDVSVPLHKDGPHLFTAISVEGILNTQFTNGGQNVGCRNQHCVSSLMIANARGMQGPAAATLSATNKAYILLGESIRRKYGGSYYAKGQNLARVLTAAYDDVFRRVGGEQDRGVDVIVMPTCPNSPTPIPTSPDIGIAQQITASLNMVANTCPFNVSGHPAITVPVAYGQRKGVAGLMIVGRKFDEATILAIAKCFELLWGVGGIAAEQED